MKSAKVFVHDQEAGALEENERGKIYTFRYHEHYSGPPVSLSMPTAKRDHRFAGFPPFFDGLLPEGHMLEALLKTRKIDRDDFFSQLIAVGADLVGAVSVYEVK